MLWILKICVLHVLKSEAQIRQGRQKKKHQRDNMCTSGLRVDNRVSSIQASGGFSNLFRRI